MVRGDLVTVVMRDGTVRATGMLSQDLEEALSASPTLELEVAGRPTSIPKGRILWVEAANNDAPEGIAVDRS